MSKVALFFKKMHSVFKNKAKGAVPPNELPKLPHSTTEENDTNVRLCEQDYIAR